MAVRAVHGGRCLEGSIPHGTGACGLTGPSGSAMQVPVFRVVEGFRIDTALGIVDGMSRPH